MSSRRLCSPLTRFCPPEATVSRKTSGLVSAKFDEGVDVLPGEEVDLLLGLIGQALDTRHLLVHPAGRDEVALLDVVEQEVLVPVLVLEAAVSLRGHRPRGRPGRP